MEEAQEKSTLFSSRPLFFPTSLFLQVPVEKLLGLFADATFHGFEQQAEVNDGAHRLVSHVEVAAGAAPLEEQRVAVPVGRSVEPFFEVLRDTFDGSPGVGFAHRVGMGEVDVGHVAGALESQKVED